LEPAAYPFYTRRAIGRRLRFLVLMLFLMYKGLRRLCSMRWRPLRPLQFHVRPICLPSRCGNSRCSKCRF
jgi:hypothetical protein